VIIPFTNVKNILKTAMIKWTTHFSMSIVQVSNMTPSLPFPYLYIKLIQVVILW